MIFGLHPGLTDCLFPNKKSQISVKFGGPLNGKCWYDHLEYFMAIWYIFPNLECLDQEKSGNPGCTVSFDSSRPN
jgi:hypothetical protein